VQSIETSALHLGLGLISDHETPQLPVLRRIAHAVLITPDAPESMDEETLQPVVPQRYFEPEIGSHLRAVESVDSPTRAVQRELLSCGAGRRRKLPPSVTGVPELARQGL